MGIRDSKKVARKKASDNVIRDKAFNIAKKPKYDGYQHGIASVVSNFFDEYSAIGAATRAGTETLAARNKPGIENKIVSNKELAGELEKPIIKKFEKRKANSSFKIIFRGVDLAHMQLISKFKRRICFLLFN